MSFHTIVHNVFQFLKTDWHKVAVVLLILKDLRVVFHTINAFKKGPSFFADLKTPAGRELIWTNIKNYVIDYFTK